MQYNGFTRMEFETSAKENVIVVLKNEETGAKRFYKFKNLVTDDGDEHYAEAIAAYKNSAETATHSFLTCVLGTGITTAAKTNDFSDLTPISGSTKNVASGWPLTDDQDADNTGAGVDIVSYKFVWATTDFADSSITELVITNSSGTSAEAVLNRALFASSFAKTGSDTLTVYVNHELLGV